MSVDLNSNFQGGDAPKTFLSHVFSTTEEGKADIFNAIQYSVMGVIPIVMLNKVIQRFIPDADTDKSSLEITVEIVLQLIVMFCGIIVIHRAITYFPSYSGFKYDNLALTNVILAFLIIVLSVQTKLGIKVNILFDRVVELWDGPSTEKVEKTHKQPREHIRIAPPLHNEPVITQQIAMQPPPPPQQSSSQQPQQQNHMTTEFYGDLLPANSLLGNSFGNF